MRQGSASLPLRSRAALALLPAGTLAGHALVYAGTAHHDHRLPHGYLSFSGWLAVPLAVAALVWFAHQGATKRRPRWPVGLVIAQPVLFLAQEATERVLAGQDVSTVLAGPVLHRGLALQVLAAFVVLLASVSATAAGRGIAAAWPRHPSTIASGGSGPRGEIPAVGPRGRPPRRSSFERGPPHLLVPA